MLPPLPKIIENNSVKNSEHFLDGYKMFMMITVTSHSHRENKESFRKGILLQIQFTKQRTVLNDCKKNEAHFVFKGKHKA